MVELLVGRLGLLEAVVDIKIVLEGFNGFIDDCADEDNLDFADCAFLVFDVLLVLPYFLFQLGADEFPFRAVVLSELLKLVGFLDDLFKYFAECPNLCECESSAVGIVEEFAESAEDVPRALDPIENIHTFHRHIVDC